jgi:hypothetical protein
MKTGAVSIMRLHSKIRVNSREESMKIDDTSAGSNPALPTNQN